MRGPGKSGSEAVPPLPERWSDFILSLAVLCTKIERPGIFSEILFWENFFYQFVINKEKEYGTVDAVKLA